MRSPAFAGCKMPIQARNCVMPVGRYFFTGLWSRMQSQTGRAFEPPNEESIRERPRRMCQQPMSINLARRERSLHVND